MWHVDEGTLHAFLDERERPGSALDAAEVARLEQHLRACGECAAALEREAHVRGLAGNVLADAAPAGIEVLRFEQLPKATSRPRRSRRWATLAWAASITGAIGAGWIGNALWRSQAPPRAASLEQAARDSGPVPAAPAITVSAPEPAPEPETAPPAARQASGTVPKPRPEPVLAAGAAAGQAAAPAGAIRAEEAEAKPAPVPVAPPAGLAAASPERTGERIRADSLTTRQADLARKVTEVQARTNLVAAPPAVALDQLVVTGAVAVVDWPEREYPGDTDVAWKAVSTERAERILRDTLYLLPGAAIRALEVSADDTRVRVRQGRPGGEEVELVQWRTAEAEAKSGAALAPAGGVTRDGREYAVVRRGGITIALKAPAGERALPLAAELSRRIEPERR